MGRAAGGRWGGSSLCRAGAVLPPRLLRTRDKAEQPEPRPRLPIRAPPALPPAERRGEGSAAAVTAPEPQLPAGPPLCLRLPIADQ